MCLMLCLVALFIFYDCFPFQLHVNMSRCPTLLVKFIWSPDVSFTCWKGMLRGYVNSTRSFFIYWSISSTIRSLHSMIKYWKRMNRCMPCWQFAFHYAPKQNLLRKMWTPNWRRSTMTKCWRCRAMMMKHMLSMMSFSHMPVLNSSLLQLPL